MTFTTRPREIRIIPIERITVLNTRERNQEAFEEIVRNIKAVGLKKPITVTPRAGADGAENYLLVCGEGRLRAFKQLGEARIPALVVAADDEEAFIMSLTENIARRKYQSLELLAGISQLQKKGNTAKDIADKTGLSLPYVTDILALMERGEERLLIAVEQNNMPLNVALTIARAGNDDKVVQLALEEAYETGQLRGKQLMHARRLLQRRQLLGRTASRTISRGKSDITTSSLVRAYQKEVLRQQTLVKKASFTQQRLLIIVGALRQLFSDKNFQTLLRAEQLDSLPKYLADRVALNGRAS